MKQEHVLFSTFHSLTVIKYGKGISNQLLCHIGSSTKKTNNSEIFYVNYILSLKETKFHEVQNSAWIISFPTVWLFYKN